MPFRVNCPKCQTPFTCRDEHLGKKLQCTNCGQAFQVGGAPEPKPAPPSMAAKPVQVQARPSRVAVPQRTASAAPALEKPRSRIKAIAIAMLAALLVGTALGSAGTYFLMRKQTPSTPNQLAQAEQRGAGTGDKEQPSAPADNPTQPPIDSSERKPPERQPEAKPENQPEAPPEDKPEPKREPKAPPKPEPTPKTEPKPQPKSPPPAAQRDLPVTHGGTLGRKATAGKPFTYQLSLPEGRAKYAKLEGPPDLEISTDGLLQWTPANPAPARQSITVKVNSAANHVYFIEVIGTVAAAVPRPEPKPQPRPGTPPVAQTDPPVQHGGTLGRKAIAGQPFTYQLSTPRGPAKYVKTDGPTGLEISETGLLRWTPEKNKAGKFRFMAQVNNGGIEAYFVEVVDTTDYHMTLLGLSPPTGSVMTADNVTLIVALGDQGQLVYFDTLTNKEVKRVEVDFQPGALALQGDTLFAAAKGGSQVYALEPMTGKVKKEYSVGSDAIAHLACHPSKGLLYASNNKFDVYSINPATGTATKTPGKGFFLAVDPVDGKYLYAGAQPPDRDEIVFKKGADRTFRIYWDRWGRRAFIIKYAVAGDTLKPVSSQNNAAVNGWWMHLTPDGKRIMIVGGGGWRPKDDGAGGGYVAAIYNTDNLESMLGQAPHGLNTVFHPVLNLGVTNHYGSELTLFNGRSLTKRQTIPICKAQERRPSVLTFGGKGTKIILWNGPDVSFKQGLYFIPLELTGEDRAALEKKYGKPPPPPGKEQG
jgi:hypothetical protein